MIAIIDYDAGNIKSVEKSLNYLGEEAIITRDHDEIVNSDKVILPGVGAFADAMEKIRHYGLEETIHEVVEKNIPFLGICLGMQMTVVEFARNVLGLKDANSEEFAPYSKNQVIHIMDEQKGIDKKGGTMRLGSYPCVLKDGSLAQKLYGKTKIAERHRHRFEYNNKYKEEMEKAGLLCTGTSPDGRLVEIVEMPRKTYFIAGQFHPEFKSRPNRAHPLFVGLVKAGKEKIEK